MAEGVGGAREECGAAVASAARCVTGFMLLEFLIYSVLVVGIVSSVCVASVSVYGLYHRMIDPLVQLLSIQRILCSIERDLWEGSCEPSCWQSGEGIVGWHVAGSGVVWRVQGKRLWYERDGSRVAVCDDIVTFSSKIHVEEGIVKTVWLAVCGEKTDSVQLAVTPRASVIACKVL